MRRRVVLVVAVLLLVAVSVTTWRLATLPPSWWAPPPVESPQVRAEANRTESAVVEQATTLRPPDDAWTLELTEQEVNTWLAARLPEWIDHQGRWSWPAGLAAPQVRFRPGRVSVAMQVPRLTITDEKLHVTLERAAIGRIPVPGEPLDYVASVLGEAGPNLGVDLDSLQRVIDVLAGRRGVSPVFRLGDGRRVIVRDVRCGDGTLTLVCATAGPDPPDAGMVPSSSP
jgi:hypothetical protein